jgi:hypothetical protein
VLTRPFGREQRWCRARRHGRAGIATVRIVHIGTADNVGGAARAAFQLHEALLSLGHDSRMLVGQQTERRPTASVSRAAKWNHYAPERSPYACFLFGYCMTKFSRNVTVKHEYRPYEFTILVKLQ